MEYEAYDYSEHVHRFGVWAAARAASVKGNRFRVFEVKQWIETLDDLRSCAANVEALPEPECFEIRHQLWREALISEADKVSHQPKPLALTHGIAAKIINVYLKAVVIDAASQNHPKVRAMHPPIDRLLLKELRDELPEIWQGQNLSWSTFGEEQYVDVINRVKRTVGTDEPLWKIEQYWRGYR